MEVTPSIPAKSTGRSLDSQTKRAENRSNPALDFLPVGFTLKQYRRLGWISALGSSPMREASLRSSRHDPSIRGTLPRIGT